MNRQKRSNGPYPILLLMAAVFLSPSTMKAQQARDPGTVTIEEIIVTAQKREQRLFEVPMSVSAISGEEIRDRSVTSLEELQYSVPGLSITEFSPGQQRVQIRGISSGLGVPTVGRYLDEMAVNTEQLQQGLDVRLIDMARVEVLRGPQGTLYGQGSMGGTIKYITASPELDRTGFAVEGALETVSEGGDGYSGSAMLNVPIIKDEFGLRFVAAYEEFPGWVDNSNTGEQDINSGDVTTLRGKALWEPHEDFRAELLWMHQQLELDNMNFADSDGLVAIPLSTFVENDYDVFNLVLEYDFNRFSVISSTGYLDRSDANQFDVSAFFIPVLENPPPFGLGFPPGTFSAIALTADGKSEIFTQEVRFSTNTNGPWHWTGGIFYRDSDNESNAGDVVIPDILPFDIFSSSGTNPATSQSWAVFTEASYAWSDKLEFTVGLRYFEDERKQDITSASFGSVTVDQQVETFDTVNPRLNLLYRVSDRTNVYFNIVKGFRSGGFNLQSAGFGVFEIPPSYGPEELWSYEVGSKMRLLNDRVNLEAAVYYNDWTDVQSSEFVPGSPITVIVNSGEASGWGADFLLDAFLTSNLQVSFTAGYIDATFDTTSADRFEGDPLDFVPELTGSASATWRFNWTSDLPGMFRLDYQYQDKFEIILRNFADSVVESDSLTFLNARVGIEKERWQVYLEGRNLLDEDGIVFPAVGVSLVPVRPEPVSAGISFRYQY